MPRREFPVEEDESGSRLETFLRKRLGLARNVAFKALRKGWVRVDGKRAKGNQRLEVGQQVKITNYALPLPGVDEAPEPPPPVPESVVERARASIRYQDADLVVAAKPAGEVVHKGSKHPYGWADALGWALGGEPLAPVGRLDRDTSGLLLLTRTRGAARALFAGLREGTVARTYQALILGRPREAEGRIELALAKQGAPGEEQMRPSAAGQAAVTRWRLLDGHPQASLVEVELETGRTHQIRAHFHALGHPLLGDPRYSSPESARVSQALSLKRLFLHAAALRFLHPQGGEERRFEEPLPRDLFRALGRR